VASAYGERTQPSTRTARFAPILKNLPLPAGYSKRLTSDLGLDLLFAGVIPMWIPKWQRDRKKGVDSPIPTQVVSNEEFIPRPQNEKKKQVEYLTGVLSEDKAKKLGMDRRSFMASSMGMATAFLAHNKVYGNYWEVEEVETLEPEATEEKWPKGEYFIFDV